jgi:uncharacterized protein
MRKPLIIIIKLYQRALSSLLPFNHCRFYPSCSEYAIESIESYGSIGGMWLAVKRILKCHPFSKESGYDPVPIKKEK